MLRWLGPVLFVALIGMVAGLRLVEQSRADALLEREAQAESTLWALHDVLQDAVSEAQPHPGMRSPLIDGVGELQALLDLGTEEITYARDDAYMYGVAQRSYRDDSGERRQGFILHAWPLDYGVTGDSEYELGDDGILWIGQNRLGRSGTRYGYPPPFPDPTIGQPGAPWWRMARPAHR